MNTTKRPTVVLRFVIIIVAALSSTGCGGWWNANTTNPTSAPSPAVPAAAAAPLSPEGDADEGIIRDLEAKVKKDPEDFVAYNKLANYYLQRQRETGDIAYLNLALRAARASLDILPAEQNPAGLGALAQSEIATHDFAAARDHAILLTKLIPQKSYSHQTLGDALLELGDYEQAVEAFGRMRRAAGGVSLTTETRMARLATLRGDRKGAENHLKTALALATEELVPSREAVAWCRWQLGERAFATGDYATAEAHYRDALINFPGYHQAIAALGRARAAQGDIAGAIEHYEQAVRRLPDPSFIATLGDLYHIAGRATDAAKQYTLVEQIARLGVTGTGAIYNRQLALYYADHDQQAAAAYELAAREYAVRRDIYGADAVAWTALKAGKVDEAEAAMKEALRMGTQDARLYYHAGMIKRAAGEREEARTQLKRALELNPQFDPLQSRIAAKTLDDLK